MKTPGPFATAGDMLRALARRAISTVELLDLHTSSASSATTRSSTRS